MDRLPADSRLSIVGNSQDVAYVEKLHALVRELWIVERVVFFWHLDRAEYARVVAPHRCILVPSVKEGFGLIVLEANANGLPAIVYNVAGLRDSVQSGINGVVVADGDYKKMGEEICRMFEESAYKAISESSLHYVKTLPSWGDNIEKFEKIVLPGQNL